MDELDFEEYECKKMENKSFGQKERACSATGDLV
jgi:hypothetical protein